MARIVISKPKMSISERIKKHSIIYLGAFALLLSISIGLLVVFHFQFGWDLWGIQISNPSTAQYWGQIGDFVGGMLNPILSFCALIAVLYNLILQREELALARKDAKDAQLIQNKQSRIFEIQNFESVFFRLLDAHSRLSSGVKLKASSDNTGKLLLGEDAFEYAAQSYLPVKLLHKSLFHPIDQVPFVKSAAQNYIDEQSGNVGHYFRNLYQILKYIDGFGQATVTSSGSASFGMDSRRAIRYYRTQRDYANMLRAQLSRSEVICLFLNCLSSQGHGLKYYVEKYSMLKTLDSHGFTSSQSIKDLYHGLAYADSEEFDIKDIIDLIRNRHENSERASEMPST